MKNATQCALALAFAAGTYLGCGGDNPPPSSNTGGSAGSSTATGGSGGSAGTSANGGAAGSTPSVVVPPCGPGEDVLNDPNADVISSFEDGYGSLIENKGRTGGWYTYADSTPNAPLMPAQGVSPISAAELPGGGRCKKSDGEVASAFGLHFTGGPFTMWGAGMGTDLAFMVPGPDAGASATGSKGPYNASAYKGISFFARVGDGSGIAPSVRINVKDVQTDPAGKMCSDATPTGPNACNDDFGAGVPMTSTWKKYTIEFAKLAQKNFGKQYPAIKPDQLYAIQFQFAQGAKFDMWLDDIHFYK